MERLRASIAALLTLALACPSATTLAQSPTAAAPATSATRTAYQAGQLRGDERILHTLNRFTFGPRPGDLDAVRTIGLDRWFEEQLHPERIDRSDPAQADLDTRLAQFPAMQWTTADLLYSLPSDAIIRQATDGKVPVPADPILHAIYENQIARYQVRKQEKEEKKSIAAAGTAPVPTDKTVSTPQAMAAKNSMMEVSAAEALATPAEMQPSMQTSPESKMIASLTPQIHPPSDSAPIDDTQIKHIIALPADQRLKALSKLPQSDFDSLRKALKGPQRAALVDGLTPLQKEQVLALENPKNLVNNELACQRLTRDIYSPAQLQEVMTDFWLNHFNVYLHKNDETPYYLVSYERDVLRPHALGKFEDLLEATAHSPAMLLYLDNSSSMGPDSPAAEKEKEREARHPDNKPRAREGLNENYARELMELHTLGVNGGYTQADVTQVARILTGWTVDRPQRGGDFKFDANRHEPGTKKVMGKKFKEDGEMEGRSLLHMLASSPATAHFISLKLAVRFVRDDPSPALVDRMAKSYLASDGDISTVLRTLFHSPELWETQNWRAKVKTPLEFVVSAARASDVDTTELQPMVNALQGMGMPLYGAIPPTGYSWQASTWVSTGALVNRMNFALQFASNKLSGIPVSWTTDNSSAADTTPDSEEQRLESWLVAGGLAKATRAAVLQQFADQIATQRADDFNLLNVQYPVFGQATQEKPATPPKQKSVIEKQDQLLAGLLLGSPEFQRR